mgnify:FL=1
MFDDFDGYEQPESWFEDSPYEGIYHQEPGDYDTYDDEDTDEDTDDEPYDYDDYVREPGDYVDD